MENSPRKGIKIKQWETCTECKFKYFYFMSGLYLSEKYKNYHRKLIEKRKTKLIKEIYSKIKQI